MHIESRALVDLIQERQQFTSPNILPSLNGSVQDAIILLGIACPGSKQKRWNRPQISNWVWGIWHSTIMISVTDCLVQNI